MGYRKVFKMPFITASRRNMCVTVLGGFLLGMLLTMYGMIELPVEVELKGVYQENIEKYQNTNKDQFIVPNIVHYIWFGNGKTMSFINYVSILSAHKIQKPDVIMLHCNDLPHGEWWEKLWKEVPLRVTYREPPSQIHGQRLLHSYHKGDVAKMEILMQYGGIYLDYDVIMVNSMDPLRKFPMTFGKERKDKLNAGIMIAHKDALFLQMMYESYRNNYRPLDWDYNCQRVTYKMYEKRPDLVHVVHKKLTTPDWTQRNLLFENSIDWKPLYSVHLMMHLDWSDYTPATIATMNSTIGEIIRNIYWDSPEIRK